MARRWGGWTSYPASRPIPVNDGLAARSKRGRIGETWWSARFVQILESLAMGGRMARGRSYARKGQVATLAVSGGEVIATVQGSRRQPYTVRLHVGVLDDAAWDAAVEAMASEAIFAAQLLAGEMPESIEEAFAKADLTLFPTRSSDLNTSCSCPDWANPCKHVAAALYILAEQFDVDPWAIFVWRGRSREQLLEQMRALRPSTPAPAIAVPVAPPRVPLADPRDLASTERWFRGDPEALDRARDAVAHAVALARAPEVPLPRLLGASGIQLGGVDLSDLVGSAYAEPDDRTPRT